MVETAWHVSRSRKLAGYMVISTQETTASRVNSKLSEPAPSDIPPKDCLTSSNSAITLGPSIQIPEPMGEHFSFKPPQCLNKDILILYKVVLDLCIG